MLATYPASFIPLAEVLPRIREDNPELRLGTRRTSKTESFIVGETGK